MGKVKVHLFQTFGHEAMFACVETCRGQGFYHLASQHLNLIFIEVNSHTISCNREPMERLSGHVDLRNTVLDLQEVQRVICNLIKRINAAKETLL